MTILIKYLYTILRIIRICVIVTCRHYCQCFWKPFCHGNKSGEQRVVRDRWPQKYRLYCVEVKTLWTCFLTKWIECYCCNELNNQKCIRLIENSGNKTVPKHDSNNWSKTAGLGQRLTEPTQQDSKRKQLVTGSNMHK